MPREDFLTTDKEKARAKAEIRRFLTRLAVFAALCGVLFGVVFGLAVVPGSAFYTDSAVDRPFVRLNFSTPTSSCSAGSSAAPRPGRSCSTGRTARSALGASRRVAAIPSL